MKILLVEDGEYSDRDWSALVVPDDFDSKEALKDYITYIKQTYPDKWKGGGLPWRKGLLEWIKRVYQVREPSDREFDIIYDPVHYGRLEE